MSIEWQTKVTSPSLFTQVSALHLKTEILGGMALNLATMWY